MFPQQATTETNIKLPFLFIFFSLLAFLASQFILVFQGENIVKGLYRIPEIWSSAHLLILGWAVMVAMGAMYQLVPVVFLTPIWSERLGFFQFFLSAIGVSSLALSFVFAPKTILYSGSIALFSILLFIFQMLMTMKKQEKFNILTLFVGSALICLLLTLALGILLAYNLQFGTVLFQHIPLLKTHILFGIAGWFTLLIFGFSYKMVPMFALAHGFSMKLAAWVYSVYVCGLLLTGFSFLLDFSVLLPIGVSGLFIGFSLFTGHIYTILTKRIKKKLDKPFMFSLLAIINGFFIHYFAMIISFFPSLHHWFPILILLYIITWIVLSIMGYLYKIVPFLWWTHRYSKEIGKESVPSLKEMINEKMSIPTFLAFLISIVGIALSIIVKSVPLYTISQLVMLLTTATFCFSIGNVIRK
ncbi:hypothetical protein [Cytobacillus sp. IB215665]|uniref:hypothetical protein n=1 Tax=Cytobacillus sp. IB215665 TaxID=3097357 RepID=UPI002A141D3B|nr:hypothetical protein [Cytobacillus sp. IB215665]MDX8364511.1 hypothetical protein [Cytobacillus sp. IB215665]